MNEQVSERVKAYIELISRYFDMLKHVRRPRGIKLDSLAFTTYQLICNINAMLTKKEFDIFHKIIDTKVFPTVCPREGEFFAYKKCLGSKKRSGPRYIVKLLVPADAKRSSAFGNKCRCDKAKVVEIINLKTGHRCKRAYSAFNTNFVYEQGKEIKIDDDYDDNRWIECSEGIHFFMTKEEAEDYPL